MKFSFIVKFLRNLKTVLGLSVNFYFISLIYLTIINQIFSFTNANYLNYKNVYSYYKNSFGNKVNQQQRNEHQQRVLLISFDGFRHDYIEVILVCLVI
jgi:hypothetical protein